MSTYQEGPIKKDSSAKGERTVERIEPEEFIISANSSSVTPIMTSYPQRQLSAETYQELLAISNLRLRLFVASAVLALIWFIWQALSPLLRSIFNERYVAINESVALLTFGLISIGVSVGIGTLLIQFRVQNRHLFNPYSETEMVSKKE